LVSGAFLIRDAAERSRADEEMRLGDEIKGAVDQQDFFNGWMPTRPLKNTGCVTDSVGDGGGFPSCFGGNTHINVNGKLNWVQEIRDV
jgi:hypothetical protein